MPQTPNLSKTQLLAKAIAIAEGFGREGAVPTKTNNPGDLVIPNWSGESLGSNISKFNSPDEGWDRLHNQLRMIKSGKSKIYNTNDTITSMAKKWTLTEPEAWASNVASALGVDPNTKLDDLLDEGDDTPDESFKLPNYNTNQDLTVQSPKTQTPIQSPVQSPSQGQTLAQLVKAKYPEYNEVEDTELEKLVRAKYPGEYDDVPSTVSKSVVEIPKLSSVDEFNKTHSAPIAGRGTGTKQPEFGQGIESILDPLTRPLTHIPSTIASYAKPAMAQAFPMGGPITDFLGDAADNLTSPAGIATLGGSALEGAGIRAVGGALTRMGSAPFITHGTEQMVDPSSTMGQRGMGAIETLGGMAGMRGRVPQERSLIESPAGPIDMAGPADNIPSSEGPFDLQSHVSGPGLQGEVSPSINPNMYGDRLPTTWQSIRNKLRNQIPSIDEVPDPVNPTVPIFQPSRLRTILSLPKGMLSVDIPFITSAGFRQARPLVGTMNWFKAWIPSVRTYGSQAAFDAHELSLQSRENFPLLQKIGIDLADSSKFSRMEESIRSTLAERLPLGIGKVIKASNRSYNAFLNDIRINTADDLVNDALKMGLNPEKDKMYFKAIGDFVNDATGRGKLDVKYFGNKGINLERSAKVLNDVFFAPRLVSSRVKFFNPNTYINAPKGIRALYVKGLLRTLGTWGTVSGLGYMAGADVSMDPTSADFGKMKIGDLRIDPGAGFQQILVGLARLTTGQTTSSTTDKTTEFGKGNASALRTAGEFARNKLSPIMRFAVDILDASEQRPVNLADRSVQMAIPLIIQDLMEVLNEDPSLLMLSPFALPAASAGVGGIQRYGKGISDNKFLPEDFGPTMTGFPMKFGGS